jgi:hypothetical protein
VTGDVVSSLLATVLLISSLRENLFVSNTIGSSSRGKMYGLFTIYMRMSLTILPSRSEPPIMVYLHDVQSYYLVEFLKYVPYGNIILVVV